MPTYKITNPKTGETIRVSGNKAPTQQDAVEIFAKRQGKSALNPNNLSAEKGLYNLIAKPTVEGIKGLGEVVGAGMGTLGGSMYSNATKGNTDQALAEAEALKQARLSGNTELGRQLAEQSKNRYNTSGQIADVMNTVGQKALDKSAEIRQNSGLEGSFDQGLGSGMKTAGIGSMKGLLGALSVYDVATMGTTPLTALKNAGLKSALSAGAKEVAKRGIRNAMVNAPLYGIGNVAKEFRENEGENVGQALWKGVSGSDFTGPIEGLTGDKGTAPMLDTALGIVLPMLAGKYIDETSQKVVDAPYKIKSGINKKFAELVRKQGPIRGAIGMTDEELAKAYFGNSYFLTLKEQRQYNPDRTYAKMLEYEMGGSPSSMIKKSESINRIIGSEIDDVMLNSDEFIPTDTVVDKARSIIKKKPSVFKSKRESNAIISEIKGAFDIDQSAGINTAGARSSLEAQRTLAEQSAEYYDAWKRSGKIKDKYLYQVYDSASKEAKRLMDGLTKTNKVLNQRAPEIAEQLKQVNPKVADAYLKAKTITEKRTIMSDFINMAKIGKITVNKINNSGVLQDPAARAMFSFASGMANPWLAPLAWVAGPSIKPLTSNASATINSKIAGSIMDPDSKLGALMRLTTKK